LALFRPLLANIWQNSGVNLLGRTYFLPAPFELCGRKFGQLATLFIKQLWSYFYICPLCTCFAYSKTPAKCVPTKMGFKPTWAEPIGLAIQHPNHSATSSWYLLNYYIVADRNVSAAAREIAQFIGENPPVLYYINLWTVNPSFSHVLPVFE
jgi:hypothetical protein